RWDGWLDEARHNTLDVERCWSPAELEDAGLAVIQPALIPPGKVATGEPVLVDDDGVPRESYALEDAPIADITRRQLRLWMLSAGHDDAAIRAAIATLDEPERSQALIEYEDASTYQRSHPLFDLIGPAFEMTPADIDQAFREAALM
ncbi:hypothetical protein GGR16_004631, partial [Chelatococcus caeni]|nr:hypothetical protein [Chelatococcus caeni]